MNERSSHPPVRRVLMTTDTIGGVWTYAMELARGLAMRGVEVTLATMGALPSSAQAEEALRLPGLTLHASAFALEWMNDPWKDVDAAGEWLLALARRTQPEVVHLNGYAHAPLNFGVPVLVAAHSCVASWWRAVKHEPLPPSWRRYREEVRRGLLAANTVIAPSRAMLAALNEEYGFEGGSVVANGRDPAGFEPKSREPFIATVGRLWDEAKNVEALARVAGRLPWPLRIAGDARPPHGAPRRFAGVELLGRLETTAVADLLSRASIFAIPARYEPFGLSALEAALSGCALVLGDLPSQREIWGDAATYVKPEVDDDIASTLRALIEDDARRRALATAARARALELGAEAMVESTLAVYRTLVSRATVVSEVRCAW